MTNRYIYPAIIKLVDDSYDVSFPDIDNCFTFGEDIEDALDSAKDVLELCLYDMEQDNIQIPKASNISDIDLKKDESVADPRANPTCRKPSSLWKTTTS